MMPEDAAAVVAAAGMGTCELAPVLGQSCPQGRTAAGRQRVCAHPHHAGCPVGPGLAWLVEEVDAVAGPTRGGTAVQGACAAEVCGEPVQELVEPVGVGLPDEAHSRLSTIMLCG